MTSLPPSSPSRPTALASPEHANGSREASTPLRAPATLQKLHLGCGLVTPPDWLNVDGSLNARLGKFPFVRSLARAVGLTGSTARFDKSVFGHDLRRPLPWPEATFGAIYASHLFEHMYVDEVKRLLLECRRVLAPGGALRVVVPDVAVLVRGYVTGDFPAWTADHIHHGPRADMMITGLLMRDRVAPRGRLLTRVYHAMFDFHSHKWMYDSESMTARFTEAGFAEVRRMGFGESRIDGILDVEREIRVSDGAGVVIEGLRL